MEKNKTTIQVEKTTLQKLKQIKLRGETFDYFLRRVLLQKPEKVVQEEEVEIKKPEKKKKGEEIFIVGSFIAGLKRGDKFTKNKLIKKIGQEKFEKYLKQNHIFPEENNHGF